MCVSSLQTETLLDLSVVDLASYITQRAIDIEVKNSHKISPEIRAKIREIPLKSNTIKIQILKELVALTSRVKCSDHDDLANCIDLLNAKLLCNACAKTGKEIYFFNDVLACTCEENHSSSLNKPDQINSCCFQCFRPKTKESIEILDLDGLIIKECYNRASELGSSITPILSKQLSELKFVSTEKKLELYKLLLSINKPIPNMNSQGFRIPYITTSGKFLQRFNSIMPNPSGPSSVKAWVIDKKKNQIEALCFKCQRPIRLIGLTLTCPTNHNEGVLEYLEIIKGDSLGGQREFRGLEMKKIRGVVVDLLFENPVIIRKSEFYVITLKIDADFVYKGNPLDKCQARGSDGTEFEIFEAKPNGYFLNGQGHLSGPIIRLIYED